MKKTLFTIALMTLCVNLFAQTNDRYQQAMGQTLEQLKQAKSPDDWQQAANKFERISVAETKEWLPNYYAAYCYVVMAYMTQEVSAKDMLLDKADGFVKKTADLQTNNDEVEVLKAYTAQSRMAADPMNRWQTQGPIQQEALGKAKTLNAENPRIYVLEGTSLFYTPEQFGGGKAVACPVLKKASDKMAAFKPASPIHPNWGEYNIKMLIGQCN